MTARDARAYPRWATSSIMQGWLRASMPRWSTRLSASCEARAVRSIAHDAQSARVEFERDGGVTRCIASVVAIADGSGRAAGVGVRTLEYGQSRDHRAAPGARTTHDDWRTSVSRRKALSRCCRSEPTTRSYGRSRRGAERLCARHARQRFLPPCRSVRRARRAASRCSATARCIRSTLRVSERSTIGRARRSSATRRRRCIRWPARASISACETHGSSPQEIASARRGCAGCARGVSRGAAASIAPAALTFTDSVVENFFERQSRRFARCAAPGSRCSTACPSRAKTTSCAA